MGAAVPWEEDGGRTEQGPWGLGDYLVPVSPFRALVCPIAKWTHKGISFTLEGCRSTCGQGSGNLDPRFNPHPHLPAPTSFLGEGQLVAGVGGQGRCWSTSAQTNPHSCELLSTPQEPIGPRDCKSRNCSPSHPVAVPCGAHGHGIGPTKVGR